MHLIYFDENKYSEADPRFYIGGIVIDGARVEQLERTLQQIHYNFFGTSVLSRDTEIHGKDIFHGKGIFRKLKLKKRLALFADIVDYLITHKIPIRMVCIDVNTHRQKYRYPEPEYHLGLMLALERFCDFLEEHDESGIVFGDYEKDEITRAVLDFSQFKVSGKTPMHRGRPLGRLIDTIYFTHSHHSRFLQVADVVVFLANRFEAPNPERSKWHETEGLALWNRLKNETDFAMQKWP